MIKLTLTTTLALIAVTLSGCTGLGGDAEIYGESGIADNGGLIGTLNPGFIQQAGSSTVLPIAQAWAEDFGGSRGVQIKVAGGGSGAGGKGICQKAGATPLDIGDQSRPMKGSEFEVCEANGIEPVAWTVAYDGLSVVVSKSNNFAKDLSVEQLKQIFVAGGASTWADIDSSFPAQEIQRCAPDAESGTWDYFNEVIMEDAALHSDAERSGDDNVLVSCIAGSQYAIGFFGYAYLSANEDSIKAVKVEGVAPAPATIADGSYSPLARPIFMVTNGVPEEGSILHDYFSYAFHPEGGQALVPTVGYVALDEGKRLEMANRL